MQTIYKNKEYIIAVIIALVGFAYFYFRSNFKALVVSGSSLSIEAARIKSEQLYTAMSDFGTNENLIVQILRTLSVADFKMVYNAFGSKPYLWFGSAPSWLGQSYDLVAWLDQELSDSYPDIKTMIRSAGFSYK